MRNGYKIRLCDMADSHLENCIRLIERVVEGKHTQNILAGYQMLGFLQGECAIDSVERDLAMMEEDGPEYPEIYFQMLEEHRHRNELRIEESRKVADNSMKRLEKLWPSQKKAKQDRRKKKNV
jgi:hypothetical protein